MKLVSSGPKITVFSYPSAISPHTGVNVVCGFRHSRFSFLCSGVLAFPSSSSQENQVPAFASFSLSVGSSWLYVDEPSRKMHPLAEIVILVTDTHKLVHVLRYILSFQFSSWAYTVLSGAYKFTRLHWFNSSWSLFT